MNALKEPAVLCAWPSGVTALQTASSEELQYAAEKYPTLVFMEIEQEDLS